jgi:enoyl-CoA hydratase/carnithine racemase
MTEPTADDGDLVVRTDGPVATVWLNRPDKRNAVTHQMWEGIAAACRDVEADDRVRVVVVRGTGRHFCAGADIGGLGLTAGYRAANNEAEERLAALPKPTIALVTGACVGGGMQIAAACDLRIAEASTRVGVTPARLGIVYPASAVARLVTLAGPSAAKHLLFTAELVDADRAVRTGLVDEVHPDAETAAARVDELARLMAGERSLLTQMASKEMVDEVVRAGSVSEDTDRRWGRIVAASDDPAEGMAAFAEGRSPQFGWRP